MNGMQEQLMNVKKLRRAVTQLKDGRVGVIESDHLNDKKVVKKLQLNESE